MYNGISFGAYTLSSEEGRWLELELGLRAPEARRRIGLVSQIRLEYVFDASMPSLTDSARIGINTIL